jgi:hypothetical protein
MRSDNSKAFTIAFNHHAVLFQIIVYNMGLRFLTILQLEISVMDSTLTSHNGNFFLASQLSKKYEHIST